MGACDAILQHRRTVRPEDGMPAPKDVILPAGPSCLRPDKIASFQKLSIPTRIVAGQIELLTELQLCATGQKINASEAHLLKLLKITFEIGVVATCLYEEGHVFPLRGIDA